MKRILRWFGPKREKPTSTRVCTSYTIEEVAALNYISPEQVKMIKAEFGVDETGTLPASCGILRALKDTMNNPDEEYLARVLTPNVAPDRQRKELSANEVMLGSVIGDVIGSKYEFSDFPYDASLSIPIERSRFTDDSVLSVATRNAVIENYNNPDFRKHYIAAYKKNPTAGYGPTFAQWAIEEREAGYNSVANGATMRLSFIPAYYKTIDEVVKYTIQSSMTTHNHIEAIKGSVVLACCIWMALHEYSKEEIGTYVEKHYLYKEEDLPYILDTYSPFPYHYSFKRLNKIWKDISRTTLYANIAVPYAIKCFLETNSYEECMRSILQRGGDTDTICAIAGGLCVAYYGTTGLNNETIVDKIPGLENLITNYSM